MRAGCRRAERLRSWASAARAPSRSAVSCALAQAFCRRRRSAQCPWRHRLARIDAARSRLRARTGRARSRTPPRKVLSRPSSPGLRGFRLLRLACVSRKRMSGRRASPLHSAPPAPRCHDLDCCHRRVSSPRWAASRVRLRDEGCVFMAGFMAGEVGRHLMRAVEGDSHFGEACRPAVAWVAECSEASSPTRWPCARAQWRIRTGAVARQRWPTRVSPLITCAHLRPARDDQAPPSTWAPAV